MPTTAGAARSERPTSGQGSKRSGGRRVTDTAWQALASGERQGQRTGATTEENGGAACRQRAHRVSKMVSCASSCGATASCWAHAIITRSARSAGPSSSTQCSGKAPPVGRFWRRHSSVDHGWQASARSDRSCTNGRGGHRVGSEHPEAARGSARGTPEYDFQNPAISHAGGPERVRFRVASWSCAGD